MKKLVASLAIIATIYLWHRSGPARAMETESSTPSGQSQPYETSLGPSQLYEARKATVKNHPIKDKLIELMAIGMRPTATIAMQRPPSNDPLRQEYALALAYSPTNPNQLASSFMQILYVWDIARKKQIIRSERTMSEISSIAYNPSNANQIAVGTDGGSLFIWDVEHRVKRLLSVGFVESLAYNPANPNQIAVGNARGIEIWDLTNNTLIVTLAQPPVGAGRIAYAPTNSTQIAATLSHPIFDSVRNQSSTPIYIWNVADRTSFTLEGHNLAIYAIAYNPTDSNQLASASSGDNAVRIWDIAHRSSIVLPHNDVVAVAYNPQNPNQLVSVSGDEKSIKIWNISTQKALTLLGANAKLNSIAFNTSKPNQFATGTTSGEIFIWDLSGIDQIIQYFKNPRIAEIITAISARDTAGKVHTYTVDPAKIASIFSGILQAMNSTTPNDKYIATPEELAYLTQLVFPQLPKSAVDILKQCVAVKKRG